MLVSSRFRISAAKPLALAIALILLPVACTTTAPESSPAAATAQHPASTQMVAAVRAAAGNGEGELTVQPLRDPMVEDLRQQAVTLEQQGKYPESAAALDQALAIVPDDPAVLQERAEAALLVKDFAGAEQRAKRAWEIGSQVGALCRRHWATVRAVRYAASDGAGAKQAQVQMDACKVAAPDRF